jgi:hypothetical protein
VFASQPRHPRQRFLKEFIVSYSSKRTRMTEWKLVQMSGERARHALRVFMVAVAVLAEAEPAIFGDVAPAVDKYCRLRRLMHDDDADLPALMRCCYEFQAAFAALRGDDPAQLRADHLDDAIRAFGVERDEGNDDKDDDDDDDDNDDDDDDDDDGDDDDVPQPPRKRARRASGGGKRMFSSMLPKIMVRTARTR